MSLHVVPKFASLKLQSVFVCVCGTHVFVNVCLCLCEAMKERQAEFFNTVREQVSFHLC